VVSSAEARARRARRQLQPHEQTCSVCNGHRVPELPTDAAVINDTSRFHVQSGEHAPRFFERQARRKAVAERVFFTCEECFKCFHAFCAQYDADMALAARRVVLSGGNWYCTDCKACTVCASPTAPAQLIICDGCDRGYHTFCLNPALSRFFFFFFFFFQNTECRVGVGNAMIVDCVGAVERHSRASGISTAQCVISAPSHTARNARARCANRRIACKTPATNP